VLNSVEDSAASGSARAHAVQAHRAAAANALLFRPPSDDRPQSVHSRSYSAEKHEFPKRTSPIFSRLRIFHAQCFDDVASLLLSLIIVILIISCTDGWSFLGFMDSFPAKMPS
jgi:hypothetical protein